MRYSSFWILAILALNPAGCSEAPLAPDAELRGPSRVLLPNTGYAYVSAGTHFVCGIRSDGTVLCWGGNGPGELDTPLLDDAVQLANGSSHTCALRATGTVTCWGLSQVPAGLAGVSHVAAGAFHTCAIIESDRSLVCWGSNDEGQIDVPAGLTGVVAVAGGRHHTCAARVDGSVLCWGRNDEDQGTPPADVGMVIDLAAGQANTCALRADGTVVCWGSNFGDPLLVPDDLADVVSISSGAGSTCALLTTGTVTCWGRPLFSPDDTDITQISSGNSSICMLNAAGVIRCIGIPAPPERLFPFLTLSSSATSVMAGQTFTLALTDILLLTYSGEITYTYAFDCGDGQGFGPFTSSSTADCTIYVGGGHDVRGRIMDNTGDVFERTVRIDVAPDDTPPVITLSSPADGALLLLNEAVSADYTCTDDETGIASCDGTVPSGGSIPTTSVGTFEFLVEAENRGGLTASLMHSYHVGYEFSGFAAPVGRNTLNSVKAGQTVALKWRLLDGGGAPVTTLASVRTSVENLECGLQSTNDLDEESAAGASGLQNLGDGYYQYNWRTPRQYAGSCKTLHLDLGEGITRTAGFQFRN